MDADNFRKRVLGNLRLNSAEPVRPRGCTIDPN